MQTSTGRESMSKRGYDYTRHKVANPTYSSLHYTGTPSYTDKFYDGTVDYYDMTKPYSYHAHKELDKVHMSHKLHAEDEYGYYQYNWSPEDINSKLEEIRTSGNHPVTKAKTAKPYVPFGHVRWSKYPESDRGQHRPDRWRIKYHVRPKTPRHDDIQCILGVKIVSAETARSGKTPYHVDRDVEFPREFGYTLCRYRYKQSASEPRTVMSVVYISRSDGKLCNDIFYVWCDETKLPFPEQLIHTTAENDVALSGKPMKPDEKRRSGGHLQHMDYARNKKKFNWFLPVSKWGDYSSLRTFTSPYKSSYKKPKTISTYRKRRERRAT